MFIEDVINRYSKYLRCTINDKALDAMGPHLHNYYDNDPTRPYGETTYVADDDGYKAIVIDEREDEYNQLQASLTVALDDLNTARALPQSTVSEIVARNVDIAAALTDVSEIRSYLDQATINLEDAYLLDMITLVDPDTNTPITDPTHLDNGTEGSLIQIDQYTGNKTVNTLTANQILNQAYSGLLINPETSELEDDVLDTEDHYFTLVYDAGYPLDVKFGAENLVDQRRDCMLITDCLDQVNYAATMDYVSDEHIINSRYFARYDNYSKIYDVHTGRDIWITPVYHMANLIPSNDILYELWYAVAGFNRATVDDIKEIRYNPKLPERDQLYLKQVNPLVKFNVGYTVWGQLTSQKRPSALQDLNIMRLVLYIKRALEQFCRFYVFEFNDQETWDAVKEQITPFLENIKTKRGLKDYEIDVGATEWEEKNKICHVDVTLEPTRVIEKIELNLFVK